MATFTLTSTGTLGDHFPFLALGRMLVVRGHTVRYAGPSYLKPHVISCGMEHHVIRPEMDPELVRKNPDAFNHWMPEKGGPADAQDRALGLAQGQDELYDKLDFEAALDDVIHACEGADFLVCSQLHAIGRTASDLARVPWATVCVVPWFYPSPGTAAATGMAAREERDARQPWSRRFRDRIHAFRQRAHLEPIPVSREQDLFVAPRILLATHSSFGEPGPVSGRELVQTGFWLHEPPQWAGMDITAGLAGVLAGKPAPLVLSFSSQPLVDPASVLDVHLQAARHLGRVLIAQAGWAALQSPAFQMACERGEALLLPAGPQNRLFTLAGAVITHGGIGTVARAITAGTPLLVEPYGNDQFYNARQVVSLGIGAAVNPHRVTTEGLAEILHAKVLTDENRNRVRATASGYDSHSALAKACLALERWLGSEK